MQRLRLLGLALLASLLAAPVSATHSFAGSHLPTLLQGEQTDGGGWIAVRFFTDGAPIAFEHKVTGEKGVQVGVLLYGEDGDALYGRAVTGVTSRQGVRVSHQELGVESGSVQDRTGPHWYATGEAWDGEFKPLLHGTHTLLVWGAGAPATRWSWIVRGESGVQILGVESGREATLHLAEDMQGAYGVHVVFGDSTVNRHAQASVAVADVSFSAQAANRLVSVFGDATGLSAWDLSLVKPTGESVHCPCFLHSGPAGGYDFRARGAAAGVLHWDETAYVSIVDARLPQPA